MTAEGHLTFDIQSLVIDMTFDIWILKLKKRAPKGAVFLKYGGGGGNRTPVR